MARALKRKHDADAAEEQEKRRRLEEMRTAAEAACCVPEPDPVGSYVQCCGASC
jgi:hypothetical protein